MQQQATYQVYHAKPSQSKVMIEEKIYEDMYKKFIFFSINIGIMCLLATLGYWI